MRTLRVTGPVARPLFACSDAIGVPRQESAMRGAFITWRHVSDAQVTALS